MRELLSEKNATVGLKPLQKLLCVAYGGAGCPEELCKTLVNNNVILISAYGFTGKLIFLFIIELYGNSNLLFI